MLMIYSAFALAPLALVAALRFSAPLFAAILAVVLLGEALKLRRFVAILAGIGGGLIVLQPGMAELGLGEVLALTSAAAWGLVLVLTKSLTRTESSLTITFYGTLVILPLAFVASLAFWVWPTWEQLAWLLALGALGTVANLALAHGIKMADVGVLMPLDFTKLVWAALVGYVFFLEIPGTWTWVGGAVIFAAALNVARTESKTYAAVYFK